MAGDAAALWRPAEGLAGKIFGLGTEADAHASANSLRAASVQEMLVECERSTFPVSMGIRVNCIPPKEVTDIGERFTYTVMPLSAHHVPHSIYKCDRRACSGGRTTAGGTTPTSSRRACCTWTTCPTSS